MPNFFKKFIGKLKGRPNESAEEEVVQKQRERINEVLLEEHKETIQEIIDLLKIRDWRFTAVSEMSNSSVICTLRAAW